MGAFNYHSAHKKIVSLLSVHVVSPYTFGGFYRKKMVNFGTQFLVLSQCLLARLSSTSYTLNSYWLSV